MSGAALHPTERAAARGRARGRIALAGGLLVASAAIVLTLAQRTEAPPRGDGVRRATPSAADTAPTLAFGAPAAGTTGTIALPPEPAGASVAPAGITPAAPFLLHAAGRIDRARALECLTAAIYYEAASESDDGQRAVAQVVLNRVRHPAFPASVCGVVYQGAERGSGCQFSFACDGATARVPSRSGWSRAARTAAMALNGFVFAPVGLATHYHTFAVTPAWNRTLVMTDAIGAHFFHRWKGYWGTAAAFHQRYVGNEPVAGPSAKAITDPAAPGAPILAFPEIAALSPDDSVARTPAMQVQPGYQESGTIAATVPESTVLDRWKDSGKPLK